MKIDGNHVVFETSDKRVYAFTGCMSLDADDISLSGVVAYGSDGGFDISKLTSPEIVELADYQIGLWTRFKSLSESAGNPKEDPS